MEGRRETQKYVTLRPDDPKPNQINSHCQQEWRLLEAQCRGAQDERLHTIHGTMIPARPVV